jgi:hypothetical protein
MNNETQIHFLSNVEVRVDQLDQALVAQPVGTWHVVVKFCQGAPQVCQGDCVITIRVAQSEFIRRGLLHALLLKSHDVTLFFRHVIIALCLFCTEYPLGRWPKKRFYLRVYSSDIVVDNDIGQLKNTPIILQRELQCTHAAYTSTAE